MLGFAIDLGLQCIHLGTGLAPCLVDKLRSHRGLLESEKGGENGLIVAGLVGEFIFAANTLELTIEGLLSIILEGDDAALNDGLGRTASQNRAHLLHGPVNHHLVDEGLIIGWEPGHAG